MNTEFSSTILNGLNQVRMSDGERARAAATLHKAVAVVEWMLSITNVTAWRKSAT